MATFGGKSYKKKSYKRNKSKDEDEEAEEEPKKRKATKKGRGGDEDSEFIHVTGLFESKKGGSWTVFIKPEMIDKLNDLEEDDLLGVSESKYGMSLWIRKADK